MQAEGPRSRQTRPLALSDLLSVLRGVNHPDVRVDFDGLAVEDRWFLAPLLNRFASGKIAERIAGNDLQ